MVGHAAVHRRADTLTLYDQRFRVEQFTPALFHPYRIRQFAGQVGHERDPVASLEVPQHALELQRRVEQHRDQILFPTVLEQLEQQQRQAFAEADDLADVDRERFGDLVERVLPSRTREEVIAVLGVPRERPEFTELCYPLGNERGSLFALDAEYLIVHFDRNGRYSHVGVHVD